MARALLGKHLVFDHPAGRRVVRIVEAEAYVGSRDPASHAHRGITPRTAVMFGRPGHSYVYLVYGMYHCLNVVTERDGVAGAVLLRGAEPLAGLADDVRALAGPGRLARSLGIDTEHSGLDLVRSALTLHDAPPVGRGAVLRGPRIGLAAGATIDAPWRFWIAGSLGVSRAAASPVRARLARR